MAEWTETNPLRVVTGYHNIARKFFGEQGFEHVVLLSADGALEAAPLMGTADIILDLVGPSTLTILTTSRRVVGAEPHNVAGSNSWWGRKSLFSFHEEALVGLNACGGCERTPHACLVAAGTHAGVPATALQIMTLSIGRVTTSVYLGEYGRN